MPIYEYKCNNCNKNFELLIFGNEVPCCPDCKSTDLKRIISVFSIHGIEKSPTLNSGISCGNCPPGKKCSTCR